MLVPTDCPVGLLAENPWEVDVFENGKGIELETPVKEPVTLAVRTEEVLPKTLSLPVMV